MKILNYLALGLFLFLLTLGQLQRVQVSPNLAFYLHDILLAVWCGISFLASAAFRQYLYEHLRQIGKSKEVLFFAWVAVGLVAAFLRNEAITLAIFYLLRLGLYFLFTNLLFYLIHKNVFQKAIVVAGFLLYGVLVLYFGFLQYFLMPDTRWLFFLGWDDHYYRLISTLFDPGFTGIILVLTFCLLQTFEVKVHQPKIEIPKVLLSSLLCVGLLLTYSRASYLALLVSIVMAGGYFFQHKAARLTLGMLFYLIFFLAGLFFLPHPGGEGVNLNRTASVYARTTGISATLTQMKPLDWLIGRGLFVPNTKSGTAFQQPDHAHIPDNWIIFILNGTGVVGLIFFVILIWNLFRNFYQKNIWLAIGLVAIFIHGLFNASVVYPFVLLFLIGMVASLD